jgi:hypothetical protein
MSGHFLQKVAFFSWATELAGFPQALCLQLLRDKRTFFLGSPVYFINDV